MSRDFEDKFFDELKDGVVADRQTQDSFEDMSIEQKVQVLAEMPIEEIKQAISGMSPQDQKKVLVGCIAVLNSNVIKDPKVIEKVKKELTGVEKKISEEKVKAEKSTATIGEDAAQRDTDESEKEKEEKAAEGKEEKLKDEKDLNEDKKAKENADKLKQTYYDAMMALHDKRMQTIAKQKTANQLVASNADYEQELSLEAKMYEARDAYLATGASDPYTKKRTEIIQKEKQAKEPIELELRNRAKRFREIESQIKEIDQREREINEQLLGRDINETQIEALNRELEELGIKREKLEVELADIKDKLDNAIETRRQRMVQRAGLESQYVNTLSYEDKKNYDYQQSKVAVMNQNFDQATKQHYDNIKRRIEEREQKIKDINKELRDVPDTDFERRLVLLNELDKETNMLEADREAKSDLDRGIVPDKQEMVQEAREKKDDEEYRQEQFDKATEDVRVVIEEQEKKIGEAVVEAPAVANEEERDRDTTLQAAAVAAVYESPEPGKDTPMQDAQQFVTAKCVIAGLEEQVRNPNDPEDAQAIVAHDEALSKADNELDRVEDKLTIQ